MKKQKKYSEEINAKDYVEMNLADIWEAIAELQKATRVAALIALVALSLNHRGVKKSAKICINKFIENFNRFGK